jgi:hypothetical protein
MAATGMSSEYWPELIITVKQLSATCSQFPIYIPSTVSIIKRRALVLKRKEKQKQKKKP